METDAKEFKWNDAVSNPPEVDSGKFLVYKKNFDGSNSIGLASYAKDLYDADDLAFWEFKGKSGWYTPDSEWGHCIVSNVLLWAAIPEPNCI